MEWSTYNIWHRIKAAFHHGLPLSPQGKATSRKQLRCDIKHINTWARSWNLERNISTSFFLASNLHHKIYLCYHERDRGKKWSQETPTLCQPHFPSKIYIHEIKIIQWKGTNNHAIWKVEIAQEPQGQWNKMGIEGWQRWPEREFNFPSFKSALSTPCWLHYVYLYYIT